MKKIIIGSLIAIAIIFVSLYLFKRSLVTQILSKGMETQNFDADRETLSKMSIKKLLELRKELFIKSVE